MAAGKQKGSRRDSHRQSQNSVQSDHKASARDRRGNSPSKFQSSPPPGKGVKFENSSEDIDEDEKKKAKSGSTESLETDSLSDDDINVVEEIND